MPGRESTGSRRVRLGQREAAGGQVLTVDISLPDVEELHKLVQDGTEKGFLTYDEIVSGLEEVELTKEQIEDFYTYLIDHSIQLMEGAQHRHPPHQQPAPAEVVKGPRPDLACR